MSSMLEQAIIDAAALREAALKNAEQSLIEKYAPQIKEAVEAMLDDSSPTVLNEEEMGMDAGMGGQPNAEIEAPFAGNPQVQPDEMVNLTVDVDAMDDEIEIDIGRLERELSGADMPSDELSSIGDMAMDLGSEEMDLDTALGDEEEAQDEEELQLQELLNLLSEVETETLEEKIGPGGPEGAAKGGWIETAVFQTEEEQDYQKAADNLYGEEEEDEDDDDETDESGIPVAQKQLEESIELLKSQNLELETVVYQLSDKLEETLLSNAKLLYQNRTLTDASLNERQKDKIVEAISKAESPKEAKRLHETLRTTVGSKIKKGPQSLSESVNRQGNLSSMLNRRQNLNESQSNDPFFDKMQRLAGINK
jgi:hypothetical protein